MTNLVMLLRWRSSHVTPVVPFADENGPAGSWAAPNSMRMDAPPEMKFLEGLVDDLALFLVIAGFFLQNGICTVMDVSAGKWSEAALLRLAGTFFLSVMYSFPRILNVVSEAHQWCATSPLLF